MRARNRRVWGVCLLAIGLLSATPAGALRGRAGGSEESYSLWERISRWVAAELPHGEALSHLWAKQGLGADPDGKPAAGTTTTTGSSISLQGNAGAGSDPDGGH